ncbi:peptidoglycan recognition protein 1-like [Hyperolius riggenbachi]|uniref:peptidoglycan recognition protein 1-like n=1 Tax=Hyperolius riggenbachi TaxID=752182 RepID=UPI0035A2C8AE
MEDPDCPTLTIIDRETWGAVDSKCTTPKSLDDLTPVPFIVIFNTGGETCDTEPTCKTVVKTLQTSHMDDKNWNDIGCNFLIGGDGSKYEGRGWTTLGPHKKAYPDGYIGICFIGTFTEDDPTLAAVTAAKDLIACGTAKGLIDSTSVLKAHKTLGPDCPGVKLYEAVQNWE